MISVKNKNNLPVKNYAALLSTQWNGFMSLFLRALIQWSIGKPFRTLDVQAGMEGGKREKRMKQDEVEHIG